MPPARLHRFRRGPLLLGFDVLSLALAGCTANFGGAAGVGSGTETYRWENPGASATVSYSPGGTGSVGLTIEDAAGQRVFERSYSGSGGATDRTPTATGAPDNWAIRIAIRSAGGFSLSVQTR